MLEHNGKTYFTRKELDCNHCGLVVLAPGFGERLVELRIAFDAPMVPTSVCRCAVHNHNEGGNPRSLHVADKPYHPTGGTCAMDVAWRNWPTQKKLEFAQLAWRLDWSVGLHDGFCHIDRRGDFGLNRTVFLYGTWASPFTPADVRS